VSDPISRKSVLINLLGMPLAAAAVVSVAAQAEAKSSGTTAPSAVMYVKKSTNGKYCKDCKFYFGSKTKTGKCTVVSGPIEPMGYCVAYAKS